MTLAIQVSNVSKRYRIGGGLPNLWTMLGFNNKIRPDQIHWAVKDVSFELEPGEALGIIGPNGAGKTTILKLLSRITKPTGGSIMVNGRFSALIELGAGFHPDLTGRENIFLNGTVLGMKRAEIKARFDEIVDFAGIGQYLDTPVKRYSSGMYARLGFAIAAHVDPQVLLVDEVLAVGDHAFQMKCHTRMDELRKQGTSLIFVSHNMEAVRRVCERGMVMYQGSPIFEGTAAEAVVAYSDAVRKAARENKSQKVPLEGGLSQRVMTFDAEITKVRLLNGSGQPVTVLKSGSTARVVMDVLFNENVSQPIFSFFVRTPNGMPVYTTTTKWQKMQTPSFRAGERCTVTFEINVPLIDGGYELGVDVTASDLSSYYDRMERALAFEVTGRDYLRGLVDLDAHIQIQRQAEALAEPV
jgi:lipopolysaccharide transport system ATP-binding protein